MLWRESRALIVASGPSAAGMRSVEKPNVAVIAVNAAITGLPWNPGYWFSLDAGPRNMSLLREQREGVRYAYAVDADMGSAAKQPNQRQSFDGAWLFNRTRGAGIPADISVIHHGNSGWGAFQLAVHMGARRIAIAGVDGTQAGYWHGNGAPGSMRGVSKLFDSAVPEMARRNIEVRVADHPETTMKMFPRMPLDDLIEWVDFKQT